MWREYSPLLAAPMAESFPPSVCDVFRIVSHHNGVLDVKFCDKASVEKKKRTAECKIVAGAVVVVAYFFYFLYHMRC